jgi:hypothetical protein
MATTPNYSWVMPAPTDFVTDLPADFEIFGDAVDATVREIESQVEINTQTGTTYTLVLADAGKLITSDNASPVTITVPPNDDVAFPIGTRIDVLSIGAGLTTLAEGSGVTINSKQSHKKLFAQGSAASLIKLGTNSWFLVGDLSA